MPEGNVIRLSGKEEQEFQNWYSNFSKATGVSPNPDETEHFYDYRGFWNSDKNAPVSPGLHLPDTFKLPGHPTFSVESKYAVGPARQLAGSWNGETFIPANKKNMPEEVQLTPEQQAQYDKMAAGTPAELTLPVEINPIRDFDANQLAELAVKDKEGFDLVGEFRRNQDLWADPATVQKTADALNIVKQRGFELSDLPGPKKIIETVWDSAKGFGKQLWNYGGAAVGMAQGALTEPFSEDLATGFAEGAAEKLAKNIAGTEEAITGLSQIPGKIISKARRVIGPEFTPEQKVADLWKDVGVSEVQQQRVTGQGPFTQAVTGGIAGELPAEEVSTLAAGDPFSFVTFSKGFQLAGKLIPGAVRGALAKTGEKVGDVAATVGGRTVQTAGKVTELGARAAQAVAPAAGLVKGAIEAGPVGALAGLKAGEIAASVAKKVSTAGAKVAEIGKQVAGATPVTSSLAQAGRDILQAVPGAAGTTAIGLGQDIGLSALTSETPAETQGAIGIGTALGVAGAAGRVARRVISGQLVAPREYGVNTVTPSSGNFPTLDAVHSASIRAATPGEQTRLNAVRLFAKGAAPGTDIFFARDAATLTKSLTDLGIAPDTAAQYAQQEGFFTVNLPDKSGTPRKVIIARNVEAAPHEAFHAVQDVLGEAANREIDKVVRQEYADRWEAEGERYAIRLAEGTGRVVFDWRETILDDSGWGHAEAVEKLSNTVANEVIGQTGAEPPPGFVEARVRTDWRRIYEAARSRNPKARPEQVWREILSPEEATAAADRYLARDLAAENWDMVFKNLGASLDAEQPLARRLAGVAAKLISTFGGEPLAGRRSEIGQIEPRFRVTETITQAVRGSRPETPVVTAKPTRQPVSVPRTSEEAATAAESAKEIAASAPEAIPAGGTRSPRELLGEVAEAIAQRAGVKINYLSAPGEPAAATTSNRVIRRELIEIFRNNPELRVLWEKTFFPERVIQTKGGNYQILGWAPEVYAANAHKLAGWLTDHPSIKTPYAVDPATKSFTPESWRELYTDTQQFVRNQQSGATGAGAELVVPRSVTERGFTAPARTGQEAPLAQDRADVINMLFGFKLPETPRIQKGRLPLAIVGEDISAATQPGRVEVPVRPRGEFAGIEAASQDIAGRPINEVNPFRNAVEAAGNPPSLIEAVQRLNLENIKEVALAPEQPEFRGNTLTLTAGFQPSANPRAVKMAAVRDEAGGIYEGVLHAEAAENALKASAPGLWEEGFTTNDGEFLTREEALSRARDLKQIPNEKEFASGATSMGQLEASDFEGVRQFQPKSIKEEMDNLATRSQEDFKTFTDNYKSEKFGGGLTGWAFDLGASAKTADDVATFRQAAATLSAAGKEAMAAKDFSRAMELIGRSQAAREAFEAATGRTLDGTKEAGVPFIRAHYDPSYKPPVPPVGGTGETVAPTEGQFQPAVKQRKALKFPKASAGGFKKAWVLPNGEPVQLGGTWHHEWLSDNPDIAKKYKLAVPEFTGNDTEQVREGALRAGFVRVNYGVNTGTLTVEARAKDWRKVKNTIEDMVSTNLDDIDNIQVSLFDDAVTQVVDSDSSALFNMDSDQDKLAAIPFITKGEIRGQFQPKRAEQSEKKWESPGKKFWLLKSGQVEKVSDSDTHSDTARDFLGVDDPGADAFGQLISGGALRAVVEGETLHAYGDSARFYELPKSQKNYLEDYHFETGHEVEYNDRPIQFQPQRAGAKQSEQSEGTLFDLPESTSFPEAVIPKRGQTDISSNLVGSPLFKQAKTREEAISLFADKLKQEAERQESNPAYAIGKRWYSEFTPLLKKEFGSDAPLMAELLAATSPQTNVETNFGYAIDVLNNWKAGKYDKLIAKFDEGYRRLEDGSLAKIYRRDVRDGKVENPPDTPTDATYIAWWILKHDLLPRGTSGAQVGLHSKNVAKVLTRRWLSETKGPKTKNFVQNLIGTGDEATIDIWADRLLRRIGYEGLQEKWRIKPEHARGVSDEDFEFGQQVFRAAANKLGMKPSDLQAALWFTEKQRWADNGWSAQLDLGDFRTEIKRTEEYRRGFAEGKGPGEVRRGAKEVTPEYEQQALEITPRRVRLR